MDDLSREEFHGLLAACAVEYASGERVHEGERWMFFRPHLFFERCIVLCPYPDHVGQSLADQSRGQGLRLEPAAGIGIRRGKHHDHVLMLRLGFGDGRGIVGLPRQRLRLRWLCCHRGIACDHGNDTGKPDQGGNNEGMHARDYGLLPGQMPVTRSAGGRAILRA